MDRVSALEAQRRIDARNRTLSQRRIEAALANIIDPELETSLTFKVNALYDILKQIAGIVKFLKAAGGVMATLLVLFELIQVAKSLGWIS